MTLTRSVLMSTLVVTGVIALADRLPAQDLVAFVSTLPGEPATGVPRGKVNVFALRPNAALPFHVYLQNTGDQENWANVTVRLTADEKGTNVLAEGLVDKIGKRGIVRVNLQPKAVAAPVAVVPKPAGDEKGKPPAAVPAPPAGSPAPAEFYLHVIDDKKLDHSKTGPINVRVRAPREYVTATPRVLATDNGYSLTVTLARYKDASEAFRGKPAPARLDIRPELVPGLDPASLQDGTFQTVVSPSAGNVVLVANNLRFTAPPTRSEFSVSVDGYDRAFVFTTDFTGTTPTLLPPTYVGVRIDSQRYAVPGRPYDVRLEVYNDSAIEHRPRLEFYRAEQGEPELLTTELTTPRQQVTTYRVGETGELVFTTEVKDWVIPLDTAGIYGTRRLAFSLVNQGTGQVESRPTMADPTILEPVTTAREVTFDPTPPVGVRLLALPPRVEPKKPRPVPPPGAMPALPGPSPVPGLVLPPWAGPCVLPPRFGVPVPPPPKPEEPAVILPGVIEKNRVRGTAIDLYARASDPESGVTQVLFYLNAPPGPDGKLPPGAKALAGRLVPWPIAGKQEGPPKELGYTATFELPDVKGPVAVGVRFTNGAGLVTEDLTHEIALVDPDPPPTTGTIEGRLVQGSTPERPQPGLTVLLTDLSGAVVKTAITDAAGAFTFEELKPGTYAVMSVKPADLGARAIQPATVEAGEVTTVTLELKR